MDCQATTRGSIPGGGSVKTELHVLRKGHYMGVSSLNDLVVDGTLTNQSKLANMSKPASFGRYHTKLVTNTK